MTTAEIETREEWLKKRRTGIGGSDAAAVCGLSSWKTSLEVYYDKIGESEDVETPDKRRGTLLEPVVRQMYCDATGFTVLVPDNMIRHPVHKFAITNLDGVVGEENLIYEGKTARDRRGWGEPGSDEIPIAYLTQVQHYMMVARMPRADVAVMFGQNFEFAIYHIEADLEFQGLLLEHEAEFWDRVQKRIPPEPTTAADMVRAWPRNLVESVPASADDLCVARVLAAVKDRMTDLNTIKEQAETLLKRSIRDTEGLHVGDEMLCTWRSTKEIQRFDTNRFQKDHPDLYGEYLTEAASQRKFLLKGKTRCLQKAQTMLPPMPENLLKQIPQIPAQG